MADAQESDLRRRTRTRIAQHLLDGHDITDATRLAVRDFRDEAAAKGWTPAQIGQLALFVTRVGAEWAADLIALAAATQQLEVVR